MKARRLCVALIALAGGVTGVLSGCSGSGDTLFSSTATTPGKERSACRSDGSCDPGLECRSDLCVSAAGGQGSGGTDGSSSGASPVVSVAGTLSSSSGNGNATGGSDATAGTNAAGGSNAAGGATMSESGDGPGGAGGSAVQCEGVHPLVSDKSRYCEVGSCYCSSPFDTCFPAETAMACCDNNPRCGDQAADRGVNCAGSHPIIGPPRTCAPGNCFCSDGDAKKWDVCLPKAVAEFCCPPGVSLTCVN